MSGKLIIVEGNIAAGKSTLVKALGRLMGAAVFIEPALDNPYLERFYADPVQYALTMQLYLLRNRFETYVRALQLMEQGQSVILDRSIFSDFVFAKKNHTDGNISDEGFKFYMSVRNQYLDGLPFPDIVLYLDVSSTTCQRRIREGLEDAYEQMLEEMSKAGCLIERLDWERFGNFRVVWSVLRPKMTPDTVMSDDVTTFINDEGLVQDRMRFDVSFGELYFDAEEGMATA